MNNDGILLESGTNEVELLEFYIGEASFAINVAKVQAVVQFQPKAVTHLPETTPSIRGTYLYRGETLPLIDLAIELGRNRTPPERQILLITEFNQCRNAFLVDGVNRIHRLGWDDLKPLGKMLSQFGARMTGSVHLEGHEILVIDMEYIVAQLFPETSMEAVHIAGRPEKREAVLIWLAEDSATIAAMIKQVLGLAGYSRLRHFPDGEDTWEAFERGEALPDTLVSDIEMPRLDGLTLCRRVKEASALAPIPVIMFSSLINDQMRHKCTAVKADACISKPEIARLVALIDQFCLSPTEA